jgi:hypothetical protein
MKNIADTEFSQDELWERRHKLVYTLSVGLRYHRHRQRFFDLLDKGTKAVTVFFGASVFSVHVADSLPLIAAIISGTGLLSLVFSYAEKRQVHHEMASAYMLLRASIQSHGWPCDATHLNAWEAELDKLTAKSPPTLSTLVLRCQNEENAVLGHHPSGPIGPVRSWLVHWL